MPTPQELRSVQKWCEKEHQLEEVAVQWMLEEEKRQATEHTAAESAKAAEDAKAKKAETAEKDNNK